MRDLTVGEAVKAIGAQWPGVYQPRALPRAGASSRTRRPPPDCTRVTPKQLNDDALGRAVDTLYAAGVTSSYRRMAATAAQR